MIQRVLVVCTGNICRSPMAAALLEQAVPGAKVESAGTAAVIGSAADPQAVELMRERGLDIHAHRARQFETWMGAEANLIIVMDHAQREFVVRRCPPLRGRVYRLGDFDGRGLRASAGFDVPDPYRMDRAAFESSLRLVEAGVAGWATRIAATCMRHGGAQEMQFLHHGS